VNHTGNHFSLRADFAGFRLRVDAAWSAHRAALFGPSGSGKSTILEALLGLRADVDGEVILAGRSIAGIRPQHRDLGWVPQDAALFPHRSVRENLLFAARDGQRLGHIAEALQLGPLLERRTAGLSGGERQRVALGRALLSGRRFLLLDEPLASLDRGLRKHVAEFLLEEARERSLRWLLVSHDAEEVHRLADQTILIRDGAIEAVMETRLALERALATALQPD